jgi:hypothetical protein
MVMGMTHMVYGDVLSDDGGEDGIEIPLLRVERKINLLPKMNIMVAAALWFAYDSLLLGNEFFPYIKSSATRGGSRAQIHLVARSALLGRPFSALLIP